MYSLATLLFACSVAATVAAGITWAWARRRTEAVRTAEANRRVEETRALREQYARELQELQQSLGAEVDSLRERSRRPIKTLMASILN